MKPIEVSARKATTTPDSGFAVSGPGMERSEPLGFQSLRATYQGTQADGVG